MLLLSINAGVSSAKKCIDCSESQIVVSIFQNTGGELPIESRKRVGTHSRPIVGGGKCCERRGFAIKKLVTLLKIFFVIGVFYKVYEPIFMGKGQKRLRDNVIWSTIRKAVQEPAQTTAGKQE
ncbi:MAG: hypothetical protein V4456_07155 [Bacteroidota bacterium]